jgi:hypothetical protein
MKTLLILTALAVPMWAQPAFDFKTLDKFDALTNKKTKVTLDAGMLGLAASFLDGDKSDKQANSLKSLVTSLKGIYVRTWEFDKDGQYNPADIAPFRNYLKQQQWNKIVESQDDKELSEVYVQPLSDGRFGGVAIVSTEPRELTVVYISGTISMSDLASLSGNMGIPDIDLKSTKPAPGGKKKEEEEHKER